MVGPYAAELVEVGEGCINPGPLALGDHRLELWVYPKSPSELHLSLGRLELPGPSDGVPLPQPQRAWMLDPDDGEWIESTERSSELAAVRVPAPDRDACLADGRCLQNDGSGFICVPCTEVEITAPAPAERPRLTPCSGDWVATMDPSLGFEICEPPTLPPRVSCAADEVQWYGATRCTRLGTACPTGLFPEVPADGRPTLYVDANAAGPGDGSISDPFSSLATAVQNAPDDALIAIGKGVHTTGAIILSRPVSLLGACASETRLEAAGDTVLTVTSTGVQIDNLTLSGQDGVGARDLGAYARASDLRIESTQYGVWANTDAQLRLERVVTTGRPRRGLWVNHADVSATELFIDGATEQGALVSNFGRIELERVLVRDVIEDGTSGACLLANTEGEIVGRAIHIDGAIYAGVVATGGGRVELADLAIDRDSTTPRNEEGESFGILVSGGSRAQLDRVVSRGEPTSHFRLESSTATVTDLVVETPLRDAPDDNHGAGIEVLEDSHLHLRRATLRHTRFGALIADSGAGGPSSVDAADVLIDQVQVRLQLVTGEDPTYEATGILVARSAGLTGQRILARDTRAILGVCEASAYIQDLVGRDLYLSGDRASAIFVSDRCDPKEGTQGSETQVALDRCEIESSENEGARVQGERASLDLEDLHVENAEGTVLETQDHARLFVDRALIEDIRETGLAVRKGGWAEVHDFRILGVLTVGGPDHRCFRDFDGVGVCVDANAVLRMERFEIEGAATAGLAVSGGVRTDSLLKDGLIRNSSVGLFWFDRAIRPEERLENVRFTDNMLNLDLSE